jgi:UDP-N-acetylmuramoyl-L-alanyl-D-glutamate--2,6-diaminopimelate ligase
MRLSDWTKSVADAAVEIVAVTADSREVKPGALFVAIPGTKADGSQFISDAIAKGAVAVVANSAVAIPAPGSAKVIRVDEPRRALSELAATFYNAQPKTIVATTGTSGKTSVAEFTRQIFAGCGRQSASLGTIGIVTSKGAQYGSLTTPDPVTLHKTIAELARDGITHLAMEASSHGLDQHRLDGVRLAAAAFTNLGRDHMDYHPDIAHYMASKMRLLRDLLQPGQPVVINTDGAYADQAEAVARARGLNVLTVGTKGDALKLNAVTLAGFAQVLRLTHKDKDYSVELPLVGAYQVENALVAAGLALATGEKPHAVMTALGKLTGVKGRLEIIGRHNGGLAIVDYAHKPDALIAALDACRPFVTGRLICVFGCGGDRDRGKRPIMGGIAVDKADVVIVTDDNPRTEVPAAIRAEIMANAQGAFEVGDRAAAIRSAVGMMQTGDVVLIAGKGHETGQIVGSVTLPFSDQDEIETSIRSH